MNALFKETIVFIIFSASCSISYAADCNILDFKDTANFRRDLRTYLSFVNTTNSSNFEQRKIDLNSGGEALIKAIPFKAFTNFSDFNEKKSQILSAYNYKLSIYQDDNYNQTVLSPPDRDAYIACLNNNHGLNIVATREIGNDVSFKIIFSQDTLLTTPVKFFHIEPVGGETLAGRLPPDGNLSPSPATSMVFRLTPNKPFHMIVTTDPPIYTAEADYIIPKYKPCRHYTNGLEIDASNGLPHITKSNIYYVEPNARHVDFDSAWAKVSYNLQKQGHQNIELISKTEVDGTNNGPGKINRDYTFVASYDPVYKIAENPLCGLDSIENN